jgi:hypothetical protein
MSAYSIDPVLQGEITLPEALLRQTARLSDTTILTTPPSSLRSIFGSTVKFQNEGRPVAQAIIRWLFRESAVEKIYAALASGALDAFVRDPNSRVSFFSKLIRPKLMSI